MSFNSLDYILLLTATVILYYILPHKARNPLLLISSYVFYFAYDLKLGAFLIICTLVNYGAGLLMGEQSAKPASRRKFFLALALILDIGSLVFYKYFNFMSETLFKIMKSAGVAEKAFTLKLLAPLGISFIIFQVLSYSIDVYRGTLKAEKNLFRFALYVAFFPKVAQGPIERAGDIIPQFSERHSFNIKNYREGLLMVLYGLFMKMVVADRAAIVVNTIFGSLKNQTGAAALLAAVLFSLQIYFDFAGYSFTAIGTAKILGFTFQDNFRHPYLSTSPSDFWRRWHMSLNRWLRDYIYIPLGGNRCSPARKNLNTMITFGISGLWHGADWGFVVWGLLNGAFVVAESSRKTKRKKAAHVLKSSGKDSILHSFWKRLYTFILITFAWIFFRAQKLSLSVQIISRIFGKFQLRKFASVVLKAFAKWRTGTLFGLNVAYGVTALIVGIIVIVVVDSIGEKKDIAGELADGARWIRWIVYFALIFSIIMFGVYGYGYDAAKFVYADF